MSNPNSGRVRSPEVEAALQNVILVLQQRASKLSADSLVLLLRAASFEEFFGLIQQEWPGLMAAPRADLEDAYRAMLTGLKARLAIVALPHLAIGTA
ncbi:MAG: hypothetical protein AMXMBFR67_33960 [Nitrospira sp.]